MLLKKELAKLINSNYTMDSHISFTQDYLIDSEPKNFDKTVTKYANSISHLTSMKKFSLNVRKNDILDVLNTV